MPSDIDDELILQEYVRSNCPEEEDLSLNALHTAFTSVADHFNFGINRGSKTKRPQKRYGDRKVGVNVFTISDKNNPFPKSVPSDHEEEEDFDVLQAFTEMSDLSDPVKKLERQMKEEVKENPKLLTKPERPASTTAVDA